MERKVSPSASLVLLHLRLRVGRRSVEDRETVFDGIFQPRDLMQRRQRLTRDLRKLVSQQRQVFTEDLVDERNLHRRERRLQAADERHHLRLGH